MPKITAASVALTALVFLALTGCTGAVESAPDEPQDTATTSVEETVAPLVAESPKPTTVDNAESAFLEYVRANLLPQTQIPDATDAQLIAAGQESCVRRAAGESTDGMVVVEGEQPYENGYYYDSIPIITGAFMYLCPPTE